jgi:hypothetical protein
MTHLQAERETVERLRRQLAERAYRDLLVDLNSDDPHADEAPAQHLPGDTISIDWTSQGHHDWTG